MFGRKSGHVPASHPSNHQSTAASTEQANENSRELNELHNFVAALDRSQAIIWFKPDGTILDANENFLQTVGYSLSEIQGKHHRMFVESANANSKQYADFWKELESGEFKCGEFHRVGRGGREIWIQATYNPVVDSAGRVVKVVKLATDITAQKKAQAEIQERSVAVIEFMPDGTILDANIRFLNATGYTLAEIRGKHHRMFMPEDEASKPDYQRFWENLARGEYRQGQFHRVAKNGKEIWLQGAYNPVFDSRGKVVRVVKTVSDITQEIQAKQHAGNVGKSIVRGVTEMSQAIGEISERITRTAEIARNAESSANQVGEIVSQLSDSSARIDKVVSLIQDLAEQTNLLALNATIEAARAGDAGRGFAVVASEVKSLANATAQATKEIDSSVKAIQDHISAVVGSVRHITEGATEVSTNTNSVAASVEEQSLLMSGLSSNAEELLSLTA